MAGLTNFGEDLVLDFLFTANTATRPTAWYVSLYTVAPTESTGGTEVTGGSYARVSTSFTVPVLHLLKPATRLRLSLQNARLHGARLLPLALWTHQLAAI